LATDTQNPQPRAYRVLDFCKAFGVSRSTVYNLINDGKLHSVRVAGRRLIPADAAETLLRGEG
jgi:excisionase family DNA binding protein